MNSNRGNGLEEQENPLVKQLKVDIGNLEDTLKDIKPNNLKKQLIKNIKISEKLLKFIMPFALITCGTFSIASDFNFTPVKLDDSKICQNKKTEFDNRNNETIEYQYEEFPEIDNRLFYTGKWYKTDDDYFEREYRIYPISLDSIEQIKTLLKTDEELLIESLGEPLTSVTTLKNNITPEELEENPLISVVTYSKDENKCIIGKESKLTNAANTLLYLIGNAGICLLIVSRVKAFQMDIMSEIRKLNNKYKLEDEKLLKRKLEIKKENYERLTGEKYDRTR